MKNNKLIIAAAGSGKTTYLIQESMKHLYENVLITTYTEENENEIRKKYFKKYKCIPNNITIQTWFSFLIQHGVKPYQGTFNNLLFNYEIKGMLLNNGRYGMKYFIKRNGREVGVPFCENTEFLQHYFTSNGKIFSDRLPKFVVKSNERSKGELINRISRKYKYIFIDEVQDLAGYDLEIIKLIFQTKSHILLVGDPRQVTYLTHHEAKYDKYKNGKIKLFIQNECNPPIKCIVDEKSLNHSHRNNQAICSFSSKLYSSKEFKSITPCNCHECRIHKVDGEGIYLIRPKEVDEYLKKYEPIQLRWNRRKNVNPDYPVYNFGESKGKTFNRVIIYPTKEMENWIYNNTTALPFTTKAKFYVALTRARYSVGIVTKYPDGLVLEGIIQFKTESS